MIYLYLEELTLYLDVLICLLVFGNLYNVSSAIVDDDELEEDEGFILLYFDFNDDRNNPSDLDRLKAGNRSILVTIKDD